MQSTTEQGTRRVVEHPGAQRRLDGQQFVALDLDADRHVVRQSKQQIRERKLTSTREQTAMTRFVHQALLARLCQGASHNCTHPSTPDATMASSSAMPAPTRT